MNISSRQSPPPVSVSNKSADLQTELSSPGVELDTVAHTGARLPRKQHIGQQRRKASRSPERLNGHKRRNPDKRRGFFRNRLFRRLKRYPQRETNTLRMLWHFPVIRPRALHRRCKMAGLTPTWNGLPNCGRCCPNWTDWRWLTMPNISLGCGTVRPAKPLPAEGRHFPAAE